MLETEVTSEILNSARPVLQRHQYPEWSLQIYGNYDITQANYICPSFRSAALISSLFISNRSVGEGGQRQHVTQSLIFFLLSLVMNAFVRPHVNCCRFALIKICTDQCNCIYYCHQINNLSLREIRVCYFVFFCMVLILGHWSTPKPHITQNELIY